ncbi:hypothetical protein V6N13_080246 [Hibiscus sabdariffa]|uniref:Uncharacterized protein n=1 Tax=Hibiscus sabdariffa TaxID=183260 RepID=A0ABR2PXR6_9ROSI
MVFQKKSRVAEEVHVSIARKVSMNTVVSGLTVKESIFKNVKASTITTHIAPTVAYAPDVLSDPKAQSVGFLSIYFSKVETACACQKKEVVVKEMTLSEANDKGD